MSTPFYTADVTTATSFSYSLNGLTAVVPALTLTGFGTGFTYDAAGDVQTGFLEDAEFSLSFTLNFPGLGPVTNTVTVQLVLEIDTDVATILSDPEFGGQPLRTVLEEDAEAYLDLGIGELFERYSFNSNGLVIDPPNPIVAYQSDTGPKVGTETRDEIIFFSETGGRIDTLGGDDIVYVEYESGGHMRATLRRGDDVFWGNESWNGDNDPDAPTTWVNGGVGDDMLFGGNGADEMRGHNDDDILVGRQGDDRLVGGGGHDQIFGGWHDDVVFGGAGRDVIDGGLGDDVATGGLGKDVFIFDIEYNTPYFQPGVTSEHDVVQDFAVGLDMLHFQSFGMDLNRSSALDTFRANSVQDGADTVFTLGGGTITLRNTDRDAFTLESFYDKPWLLNTEFDLLDDASSLLI